MVIVVVAVVIGIATWIAAALAAGIGLGRMIARADTEEARTLDAVPSTASLSAAITL